MRRWRSLGGALLLVVAAAVSAPGQIEDLLFVRTEIAPDGPPEPRGVALGDLNRDGRMDVVAAGRSGPLVWYAAPGWKPSVISAKGSTEGGLAVEDLNQDGRPDVVIALSTGGLSWFENPKPGQVWRERGIDRGPLDGARGVSAADLDRDGDRDVVVSESEGRGRLLAYLNEKKGSRWRRQVLGNPALRGLRVSDLGDDGDADIVGFESGPVELWENRLEAGTPEDRILVFSKTAGFRHGSIEPGTAALRALGDANGFAVDATEDAGRFTAANLGRYKAVVFLSTTGDVLNEGQQAAFRGYIRQGGGFVGVHAAADTEYGWPWYGDLVGAYFAGHPAPARARIRVEKPNHPSTRTLPDPWVRFDEWYDFRRNPRDHGVTVLLTLDESSYSGGQMGADHPIAWHHEYDGGRSWYTAGGHTEASFSEPRFREHLLGGIRYAAGL
jgi:type 1 glutamine amidotransferase